jgi:hypothetical protein
MEGEFHPERIPARGERVAWTLAIVTGLTWLVLRWRLPQVPLAALILFLFLLLAALSISFSNWIDRNTVLRLSDEGIAFRNGLRDVTLTWDQIREVRSLPDRWGRRVQVIGERQDTQANRRTSFEFRTLGEVTYQGEVKGRMGFTQGEEILETILSSCGLQEKNKNEGVRYYARP